MYSTNTARKSRANKLDKYTPQARRYSRRLRYMGLRVKRYAPLVTKADVALGLVGFMVVFARQTATMPLTPSPSPTQARATATPIRTAKGTSTGATSEKTSHMRTPTSSATIGGGTFSSSQLIATNVGHNV